MAISQKKKKHKGNNNLRSTGWGLATFTITSTRTYHSSENLVMWHSDGMSLLFITSLSFLENFMSKCKSNRLKSFEKNWYWLLDVLLNTHKKWNKILDNSYYT